MNTYTIKWHGYELKIDANVFDNQVEIEDIEGISLVDFYHNSNNQTLQEIADLVLEQDYTNNQEAASYREWDTLEERD